MKNIDIFKLATFLGFDIRCSNLKDSNVASNMIINEIYNIIPPFKSNKIIFYNINLNKEEIINTLKYQLYTYLKYKTKNKLQLIEQDVKNKNDIFDIADIVDLLMEKKKIKNKNKIKTLYSSI